MLRNVRYRVLRRTLTEEQKLTLYYKPTANSLPLSKPKVIKPKELPKQLTVPLPPPRTQHLVITAKSIFLALVGVGSGVYFYVKVYGERDKERLSKTASQIGRNALSDEGQILYVFTTSKPLLLQS